MGRAITVGIGIAWRWALLYTALCFVTQLWAGSQYSAGQGGGLAELIGWSAAFGALTVVACVERAMNGSRVVDPGAVFRVVMVGHVLGTIAAIIWFTSKNGPDRGDWWIAPAMAALCATLWVHLGAPRISRTEGA